MQTMENERRSYEYAKNKESVIANYLPVPLRAAWAREIMEAYANGFNDGMKVEQTKNKEND